MNDVKPKRKRTQKAEFAEAKREVVELYQKDLTQDQIARATGVSLRSVGNILAAVEASKADIKKFREDRGDCFSFVQRQILDLLLAVLAGLTPEEVASMTPKERIGTLMPLATVLGINYDKERLERGQSTANVESILKIAQKRAMENFRRSCCADGKLPGE